MSETKDWLSTLRQEKPELSGFITLLEGYFSEDGFNASEFEKAVDAGLKSVEGQVRELLKDDEHAKD